MLALKGMESLDEAAACLDNEASSGIGAAGPGIDGGSVARKAAAEVASSAREGNSFPYQLPQRVHSLGDQRVPFRLKPTRELGCCHHKV